ncbi:MAG: hypothetical protein Q7R83_03420 [bacterium]|nr:hypothetical protein [bacterium]
MGGEGHWPVDPEKGARVPHRVVVGRCACYRDVLSRLIIAQRMIMQHADQPLTPSQRRADKAMWNTRASVLLEHLLNCLPSRRDKVAWKRIDRHEVALRADGVWTSECSALLFELRLAVERARNLSRVWQGI